MESTKRSSLSPHWVQGAQVLGPADFEERRMPREVLVSNEIAPTAGPFSAAVRAGEFIFLSGQVAQHPQTGKLIAGDVTAQAEQVFANIRAVLRAAGKTPANVVRVCVYLTDMNDFHK